jgi:hypothetical protein
MCGCDRKTLSQTRCELRLGALRVRRTWIERTPARDDVKMLRFLLIFVLCAAVSFPQSQAVAGKWNYTMETPNGSVPITLDLKVDGNKVTGTVASGERSFPIQTGSVDGGTVRLTFKRDRPQGGTMTYEITGKVDGDVMKGTTVANMGDEKVTQEWLAKRQ